MNRLASVAFTLAAIALPAASAAAQTCLGTASFASGPARVGVGLDFSNDDKQYGAQIAFGKSAGPFAAGHVGIIDVDDTDESATTFGIDLGYSLKLAGTGSLEMCPVASFGYATADIDEGGLSLDLSSRILGGGFAIGGVMSSSPTFQFIPSASLAYVNQTLKFEGVFESEDSEDYGLATLAAGFVFNETVTVRPNVAFPFGLDDANPAFGVGISVNFGTRPAGG